MKRIIITSDSHGYKNNLLSIIKKNLNDGDYFVNLGDCCSGDDIAYVKKLLNQQIEFIQVSGNCDYGYNASDYIIFNVDGIKILACHGHTFSVKYGIDRILNFAKENECSIALFGHTHLPYCEYIDNVHLLCPGTVSKGEYAKIDITEGQIICWNTSL